MSFIHEATGKAPDFTLKTPGDQRVRLSELTGKEKVVFVVSRVLLIG